MKFHTFIPQNSLEFQEFLDNKFIGVPRNSSFILQGLHSLYSKFSRVCIIIGKEIISIICKIDILKESLSKDFGYLHQEVYKYIQ